jgi:hypothetical protein
MCPCTLKFGPEGLESGQAAFSVEPVSGLSLRDLFRQCNGRPSKVRLQKKCPKSNESP